MEKVQKPSIPKEENDLPEISERREGHSIPQNLYTVQVASLGEMDKAEKMIKELIDQGHEAYYFEANVEGRTYYRIRCGKFAQREDAVKYAQRLEQETGLKGFVSKVE